MTFVNLYNNIKIIPESLQECMIEFDLTLNNIDKMTFEEFIEKYAKIKNKGMKVLSEEKMKTYMEYCRDNTSTVFCDCGNIVEVKLTPYFYDEKECDVYFAALCPKCGELIIIKE